MQARQREIHRDCSPAQIRAQIRSFAQDNANKSWPFARTIPAADAAALASAGKAPPWDTSLKMRLCHLALQGGGMHGAAHVGFLAGLETAGVRFAGVAGTSAGSIVATALVSARGKSILTTVSDSLLELLKTVPGETFIDGPRPIRAFIKQGLKSPRGLGPRHWFGIWQGYRRLLRLRGLNPGNAFETWMEEVLRRQFGVGNLTDLDRNLCAQFDDVEKLLPAPPAFSPFLKEGVRLSALRPGSGQEKDRRPGSMLKLMAACVPVGLKCEFPEDASAFRIDRTLTSPAFFVRASMAIPFFFQPLAMQTEPRGFPDFLAKSLAGLMVDEDIASASELDTVYFVDGGVFSNLPLYAFEAYNDGIPTLAVSLIFASGADLWPRNPRRPSRFLADTMGVVAAMHKQRDRDAFLSLNRAREAGINQRVFLASVNTGDVSWLDFMMSQSDIADLYHRGLAACLAFLRTTIK